MIEIMKQQLQKKIDTALRGLQENEELPEFGLPEIQVDRPKDEQFGEYTTNVALVLSKLAKKSPMEIAELLKTKILNQVQDGETPFQKIEVVQPGYLNFYLTQREFASVVEKILQDRQTYGDSKSGAGVRVNNEFISANPTGPLHLGNARGGFYAGSLSSVLRKAGYDVTNEYYVNDAGEQVMKLGHSVLRTSKAAYSGEYIEEIISKLELEHSSLPIREAGEKAAAHILNNMIQPTIQEMMQIHFDVWMSEKKIIEDGSVEKAIAILKAKELTFEQEGATWLRTTTFGDDKDRVLVKSDGTQTYFASDCGYILNKMERGFSVFIETWGADHHGYIGRFKAAAEALGFKGEIRFRIVQLVKVVKDGVEVRMSKRAGNVVTIDELIETVGHDVARFFFLMYAPETHMNFDLGLAEERSQKNPVYYVQYAHARLCSILRKAEEEGISDEGDLSLLVHAKERELIRELQFFPELIETVATDFSVHKLPQYAMKIADKFHSFYDACRVIDAENKEMTKARLQLVQATKIVLAETLSLMGISAPEKM